jgi:hypothetical protein
MTTKKENPHMQKRAGQHSGRRGPRRQSVKQISGYLNASPGEDYRSSPTFSIPAAFDPTPFLKK